MVAGYFASPTLVVERSASIDAVAEDVFPYFNDLELSAQWSPWTIASPDPDYVYGAVVEGVGATVLWRPRGEVDGDVSSEEIISSQAPDFVQTVLLLNGEPASATYALIPSEADGDLQVFLKFEKELGGFPYLQRLTQGSERRAVNDQFDVALNRLTTIVQAQ